MCLTQEDYSDGERWNCDWMTGGLVDIVCRLVGLFVDWLVGERGGLFCSQHFG